MFTIKNNFLFLAVGCSLIGLLYWGCNTSKKIVKLGQISDLQLMESSLMPPTENCRSWESYLPGEKINDLDPQKVIRVNFHYMNNADSSVNYRYEDAHRYSKYLLFQSHKQLNNNKKSNLPLHNNTEKLFPNYRYEITASEGFESNKGVYFHYDDDLYYFLFKGKNQNLGDRKAFKKYAIGQDSILNIFMHPHHPDSIASPTYGKGGQKGVALGTSYVKISGIHQDKFNPWANKGNFNHEVGHIFSLGHAWRRDGCDDTPEHSNDCYSKTNSGSKCDSLWSNNMMDYNNFQNSITPCQLGKVQMKMSTINSRTRKYMKKTWCKFKEKNTIVVSDSIVWSGEKDLSGNIIIEPGGYLEVRCRLSMPPGGKILVKNDGHLVLNNAKVHNDCGKTWEGIEIEASKKTKGKVSYIGNAIIENTSTPFLMEEKPKNPS